MYNSLHKSYHCNNRNVGWGGGYIVTVDIKMMGRCIKVINGRHIRGGYVRDIEKMSRCTVQFHNSLHKAISNKRIG